MDPLRHHPQACAAQAWSRLLAAAAVICVAGPAQAADPDTVIGTAVTTLSDLHYRLVDLAPDDGITPWVRFDGGLRTEWVVRETNNAAGTPEITKTTVGGLNEPVTDGLVSPSGHGDLTRQSGTLTSTAYIRVKDLDSVVPSIYQPEIDHVSWDAEVRSFPDTDWAFTLSPNTRIVLEGKARSDNTMDLSALVGDPRVAGATATYNQLLVHTFNSVSAGLRSDFLTHPLYGHFDSEWLIASNRGQVTADGWRMLPPPEMMAYPESIDEEWSFSLDNLETVERSGYLAFGVSSGVSISAVPEPSSLGLVLGGCGVLGLAGVRRRPAMGQALKAS